MTPNPETLPPEAEAFLRRVIALPPPAWADIVDGQRKPVATELRTFASGVQAAFFRRFSGGRGGAPYAPAAAARVQTLALNERLHAEHGWRLYRAVNTALQALIFRSQLGEVGFRALYRPFEKHIPAASLSADPEPRAL